MEIETIPIAEIVPYEKNPRKNDKAAEIVAKSIKEFGFKVPIILDKNNVIIAGHTRLKAAKILGLKEVPVIWADELSDEQVKAFRIMDNKSNEYATWDIEMLKTELSDLKDLDYNLELTGFSETEIDKLIPNNLDEDVPETKEPKYQVKTGEIYQLGKHKVLCADSTDLAQLKPFVGQIKANLCFTDPPYNVNYGGNKTHPTWKQPDNKIENDNLSQEDWDNFVKKYMSNIMELTNGAIYICMSNKEMYSNKHIFEELGGHWASFIIWKKDSFVLGMQDYQRQYEPILYGWKEKGSHYWCGDRNQSDVWDIDRPKSSPEHPTMKPIELCKKAIINSSQKGDYVLDLFGGAGSTLIACEQLDRNCLMVELDPKYCSVIIERWEKLTNQVAVKLTNSDNEAK